MWFLVLYEGLAGDTKWNVYREGHNDEGHLQAAAIPDYRHAENTRKRLAIMATTLYGDRQANIIPTGEFLT